MERSDTEGEPKYGIAMVSRLTGVNQHLLRMWERRHGAVTTHRAENGRRLYSQSDVERLSMLKQLVDAGDSIGQVAALDNGTLRERCATISGSADASADTSLPIEVAILGEYIPAQLKLFGELPARLTVVATAASVSRFRADIRRLAPNALLLEFPTLSEDGLELATELARESGASRVVVAYGFGRESDLDLLRSTGIRVVRSPHHLDDIFAALLDGERRPATTTPPALVEVPIPDIAGDASIPSRAFQPEDLATIRSQSTAIECECPKHVADLVMSLGAFEEYSADCESRNDDDAALHAYLHATTAQVRSRMEEALYRVAKAEGLIEGSEDDDEG